MITRLYLNKESELSFHVKIHIFMATAPSQANLVLFHPFYRTLRYRV